MEISTIAEIVGIGIFGLWFLYYLIVYLISRGSGTCSPQNLGCAKDCQCLPASCGAMLGGLNQCCPNTVVINGLAYCSALAKGQPCLNSTVCASGNCTGSKCM
uniref:Uncharacterized protein n=1 Tax=viral metagenome TaxID=1070528 RepID=A0A6C0JTT2_9ZZZZ